MTETALRSSTTSDLATIFDASRRHLFGVAYRLLGSATEAEDVVQDAWMRVRDVDPATLDAPVAYFTTVVSRLALDVLRSARVSREAYVGPWLPEPVPTADLVTDVQGDALRADDVSTAMLLLLERLTPDERATFVLHEAFDYPYDDIAHILHKSTPAVRQISKRARQHLAEKRARFTVDRDEQHRLASAFLAATREGDLTALKRVLSSDVTATGDGGANRLAARRILHGRDNVVRLIVGLRAKYLPITTYSETHVNGSPALAVWLFDVLDQVIVPIAGDGAIVEVHTIRAPEKLDRVRRTVTPPPGLIPLPPGFVIR
jgi:RNA polymerase sigma-70 factor (ECF subfamily)